MGFPDSSVSKESACNAGDLVLIPGLGRSPGEGKGYPLQHSGLEKSMDHGTTKSIPSTIPSHHIVHGIAKSQVPLSNCHFHFMAESEEKLKSLSVTVKEESEKAGLTLKKRRSWHWVPSLHGK